MLKRMIILGLISLLWVACAKKDEDQAAGQPAAVEAPAEPVMPADEGAFQEEGSPAEDGDSDGVPTDSDFEEEASAEITAENLESELDRLEKEIGE
jgi:hypothetical protein